jgi:hypothetical protein
MHSSLYTATATLRTGLVLCRTILAYQHPQLSTRSTLDTVIPLAVPRGRWAPALCVPADGQCQLGADPSWILLWRTATQLAFVDFTLLTNCNGIRLVEDDTCVVGSWQH